MEAFVRRSLLYDFYGGFLTAHQRRIYEEVRFNDFSISEVARDEGISRQGVHDMIRRCDQTLEQYEAELQLVERHLSARAGVDRILALCGEADGAETSACIAQIREIAKQIREEL